MYNRPARPVKLQPKWVQQQYATATATIYAEVTIGNTNWVLGLVNQLEPTDIPEPEELLTHFMYLQLKK